MFLRSPYVSSIYPLKRGKMVIFRVFHTFFELKTILYTLNQRVSHSKTVRFNG